MSERFRLILVVLALIIPKFLPAQKAAGTGGTERHVSLRTEVNYGNSLPATDALGRNLPGRKETGEPRKEKYVGLFYWTWHTNFADKPAYNVSQILTEHPEAINDYNHPAWPKDAGYYHWGEPLWGYYRDTDHWVLRKQAELLADAGVDVLIFDCTNGSFTWKESYMELCKVFSEARIDGVNTPRIAFMLGFGPTEDSRKAIGEIYADLYSKDLYKDLWFYWKEKPLIMAYPDMLSDVPGDEQKTSENREIRDFFTFRPGQPVYNEGPTREDHWGWLEIYPQHGFIYGGNGHFEQTTVGVSQNWSKEKGLSAMNAPNTFGRSYTRQNGEIKEASAVNHGYNFQEQWERALRLDPEFIFITGWNEWVAGRADVWQGQNNAFPDQYSQEKSRDIEPMKGGHGDNYYYQMVGNIRRFKGMKAPAISYATKSIDIDGCFDDWADIMNVYEAYKGSTIHRDSRGFGNLYYTNRTGRNDIIRTKVTGDKDFVYFYVETAEKLTPSTDPAWMRLLINVDRKQETGWEGYDFILNRLSPSGKALLEKNNDNWNWNWKKAGMIRYVVKENKMELSIPRKLLNCGPKANFEFKWSDNMQTDGDIMDFYLNGDTAPLGRFNYIFQEYSH